MLDNRETGAAVYATTSSSRGSDLRSLLDERASGFRCAGHSLVANSIVSSATSGRGKQSSWRRYRTPAPRLKRPRRRRGSSVWKQQRCAAPVATSRVRRGQCQIRPRLRFLSRPGASEHLPDAYCARKMLEGMSAKLDRADEHLLAFDEQVPGFLETETFDMRAVLDVDRRRYSVRLHVLREPRCGGRPSRATSSRTLGQLSTTSSGRSCW